MALKQMTSNHLVGAVLTAARRASLVATSCVVLTGCDVSSLDTSQQSDYAPNLPRLNGIAVVEFVVNGGVIVVEVDGDNAPITAGNFVDLTQRGVYSGVAFHRVVRQPEPFVVQGGDPQSVDPNFPIQALGTGNFIDPVSGVPRYIPLEIRPAGEGEEIIYGSTFSELTIEEKSPALPHRRGALAMARSQAVDSASAQFYFALSDLSFLDGQYAVFGQVSEGMDVVDQIKEGDRIQSATVISGIENLKQP
ncbi:MAG: peptidylprolyl isomerase [Cyanobacteria bacterium P01_F01_bin.150]